MQNIRWISFGIANATTRSAVHFFPSSGNVTAPYPVSCKLSLFSKDHAYSSISVDGLRLSQPEGVWVDEAFPVLKAGASSLFGLEIELSCTQQRIDLKGSSCVIDLHSLAQPTKFWPKLMRDDAPANVEAPRSAPVIKDSFNYTSLMLVNPTLQEQKASFSLSQSDMELAKPLSFGESSSVAAQSVQEIDLSPFMEESFGPLSPQECSWGLLRGRSLSVSGGSESLSAFLILRDVLTKRPVSVRAL